MPIPVSQGIAESYAGARRGQDPILTIELLNVAFPEPQRFVWGKDPGATFVGRLEADAPVNPGELVTFRAVPFDFLAPGTEKGGATTARLSVSNASSEISDVLDLTIGNRSPLIVNVRVFTKAEATAQPGDVMRGLRMRRVTADPVKVEGDLSYEDAVRQAFPLGTFNEDEYPALFVGQ